MPNGHIQRRRRVLVTQRDIRRMAAYVRKTCEQFVEIYASADPADLAEKTRREQPRRSESTARGRPAGPTGAEISRGKGGRK